MRIPLLIVLGVAAVAAGLLARTHSSASVRAGDSVRLLGAAPATERISFALELLPRRPGRARAALAAIEDPHSRAFRHFIPPQAFGRAFGISAGKLARLVGVLRAAGLRAATVAPQRTQLSVSGTVRAVDRLLRTHVLIYRGAGGRYHAPSPSPRIPPAFDGAVSALVGLDTRPRWRPHDVPIGGLTPALAIKAYDIESLHRAGFYGQGQTIAVVSFSAFDPSDPQAFARRYGLSGPAPQVVPVQGGTTDRSQQKEANLDIDMIRAIAPAARILVYESASDYAAVLSRIITDRAATVISSSWGQCERGLDSNERIAESQELATAATAGVTTFVATGDNGAYDCQGISPSDHQLAVDWPAASANAVAVGGTRLYITPGGSYVDETAWEDQLSIQGGGGGFALGDRRPPWQSARGVRDAFSTGRRQLPDVSADADPGTPWAYLSGGQLRPDGSGTSAAAPFWAAAMALIEQYIARYGGGRVGNVDPILYALASSKQRWAPFHDITVGGNRYYQAAPGWDPATGLGSPDVYNLARDILSYVRTHPPAGPRR